MILLARLLYRVLSFPRKFETCYQHFDAYFAGAPNLAKFRGGVADLTKGGGGYKKIRIFTR